MEGFSFHTQIVASCSYIVKFFLGRSLRSEPQLAWPVAIILGLIVIGILYSCIKRCVRKRKQGSNVPLPLPIHPIGPSQVSPSTNFVRTNWVDPAAYNGAGYQPGYEYRPQMPEYVPMIPLSASIVAQQNFQQPSSAQSNSQPSSAHSNSQPWLPQQPLQPINTSVTRLQHQSSSQHLISSAASPRAPDTQYEIPSNTPRESPR